MPESKSIATWMPVAILLLCTPFSAPVVHAQSLPAGVSELGPVAFPDSQRYTFEAKNVDQTYLVDVVRIASPAAPPLNEPLKVVFVTDGNSMSGLTSGIAFLNSIESLPPMYIVAIGFSFKEGLSPAQLLLQFSLRRGRDYSPASLEDELMPELLDAWPGFSASLGMGGAAFPDYGRPNGAEAFLAFINDELKPFVAERYPDADVDDSALFGHSGGAWFALNVLFTEPESFARYIAISPGGPEGQLLPIAMKSDFQNTKARLFMAFAEEDLPKIVGETTALNDFFRTNAHEGFEYEYQVFPGERHNSVVAGAFIRGLRTVFDQPGAP